MDMVCASSPASRASCARVWLACTTGLVYAPGQLGRGQPQGEISNVTLLLGQLQMGCS
jgi:hypothetical protein